MAVNYATSSGTGTTQIDPAIQPYLSYGLAEAQRLYKAGTPATGMSADTQRAIEASRARALAGSPLVSGAQNQLAATMGGQYLSGNPFFQGAFAPAAEAAQTAFQRGINDITSSAVKSGRYGSNAAMQNLYGGNANTFAKALAGTAGQLAYQNYAQERQNQLAATSAAPAMAAQDYADINQLFNLGKTQEAYTTAANLQPQENLTNFLSSIYGNPMSRFGSTLTQQTNPYYTNPTANMLGNAMLGANLYNSVNKATGGSLGNSISSGWGQLTGNASGWWNGNNNVGQNAYSPDNVDVGGGWSPSGSTGSWTDWFNFGSGS